jgi:hypothetical protein
MVTSSPSISFIVTRSLVTLRSGSLNRDILCRRARLEQTLMPVLIHWSLT